MGQPFAIKYIERFVGSCDACGVSGKGAGYQIGMTETIGADCAEKLFLFMAERGTEKPRSIRRIASEPKLRVMSTEAVS